MIKISPSYINGIIKAPSSKSSMQRACVAALINKGETHIHNAGKSNDDLSTLEVIRNLGTNTKYESDILKIYSDGILPITDNLSFGESGLGIRMITPIAALSNKELIINGKGSLLKRPMTFFDEILPTLNVDIKSNNGLLPLSIKGPIIPSNIEIDGSMSSQFLTGLLMCYAYLNSGHTIKVNNLVSKPYIDLTIDVLEKFGYEVINNDYKSFVVNKKQDIKIVEYQVEGDWSSASFLLVAGAISGDVTISGLNINSTQSDKKIIDVLKISGVDFTIENNITVKKSKINPFTFDATECPDLFPPLVALASYADGVSVISGINRLTNKESNRSISLQEEFGKIGINIELVGNNMIIHGGKVTGGAVKSHGDHRIVMACAISALGANNDLYIDGYNDINKSYVDFFKDMNSIGMKINYLN